MLPGDCAGVVGIPGACLHMCHAQCQLVPDRCCTPGGRLVYAFGQPFPPCSGARIGDFVCISLPSLPFPPLAARCLCSLRATPTCCTAWETGSWSTTGGREGGRRCGFPTVLGLTCSCQPHHTPAGTYRDQAIPPPATYRRLDPSGPADRKKIALGTKPISLRAFRWVGGWLG